MGTLGLSTLYRIVDQGEDYVMVTSQAGQGAMFEIYLSGKRRESEPVKVCAGRVVRQPVNPLIL